MTMASNNKMEIEVLLHKLWSKAANADDYDKNEWKLLQAFIENRPAMENELVETVIRQDTEIMLCSTCYIRAANKVR